MGETVKFKFREGSCRLLFQGTEFNGYGINRYYQKNGSTNKKIEFLPGIFCSIVAIKPEGIKAFILGMLAKHKKRSETLRILNCFLSERWKEYLISITFDNARDDYLLYIDDTLIISHDKDYIGKELLIKEKNYECRGSGPQYMEVETRKILFPHQSGGGGLRCSLKGVFQSMGLFRTDTYNTHYFFFDEYEMHCLAMHCERVRGICKRCRNCMRTVGLMQKGKFVGPTEGNDFDCLTLGKYGDRYIIRNGNHRACCAKVFGIPTVKAKVYSYEEIKGEHKNKQEQVFNCMKEKVDNEDILNSFYTVFHNNGISDEEARKYLKQDGTDSGLMELLQIK